MPEVYQLYADKIKFLCRDLAPYEEIKRFILLDRPFSQELDELTPTLKIRRKFICLQYKELLDSLYERTAMDVRVS